jgi:hypothetical protein
MSSDKTQGNRGDEVEQENADLVQRHSGIVQGVKLLRRQEKARYNVARYGYAI